MKLVDKRHKCHKKKILRQGLKINFLDHLDHLKPFFIKVFHMYTNKKVL